MIVARDVSKSFRPGLRGEVCAVRDVSLELARGSFAALTGPSGSGKTTLLALCGALDRPTRGHVLFDGQDLGRLSDVGLARVRRRIGFVFQSFSLLRKLPVWENITAGLIPRGVSSAHRRQVAHTLLGRFGMADSLAKSPEELSGGEQQRVAVARALAGEPDVLLADEPTSNLDPASRKSLISMLQQIHAEGKTVVVASHDPELLSAAACVYELRDGRLRSSVVSSAGRASNV